MTAIIKPNTYPNSAAVTITLASLASTVADPPVGRQSTELDMTATLAGLTAPYNDLMLDGKISTGTSPTAGIIQIWAGAVASDGTTVRRPGGAGASDAGLTPSFHWKDIFVPVVTIHTTTTSNFAYDFAGVSVLDKFRGFYLPLRVFFFVYHSTVAVLNATGGNHELRVTPMQSQSV